MGREIDDLKWSAWPCRPRSTFNIPSQGLDRMRHDSESRATMGKVFRHVSKDFSTSAASTRKTRVKESFALY